MTTARPSDGPARTFEADPLTTTKEEVFGLVLVAAWPPPKALVEAYKDVILPQFRKCFDQVDHATCADDDKPPALYLYPSECLHVTIGTLHSIAIGTEDADHQANLTRFWKGIVDAATQFPDWPKRTDHMQLVLDSCQIGKKAGILLWKEATGTIEAMRESLADEVASRRTTLDDGGVSVETIHVPDIVHSTVLRYRHIPKTSGDVVQARFRETQDEILELFPNPISVPCSVKLVCQTSPYMNIPNDADHVVSSWDSSQ